MAHPLKDLGKVFFYFFFSRTFRAYIFYGIFINRVQLKSDFSFSSKRSKLMRFMDYLLNRIQLQSGFFGEYIYYGRPGRFYGALNWTVVVELKKCLNSKEKVKK